MHSLRVAALLAGLAGLLPGCAGTSRYAADRAWDASDLLRGHVMAGVGFDVKAEATRFVGLGGGGYTAKAWGFVDRRLCAWRETIADFGLIVPKAELMVNLHKESGLEGLDRVSGSYVYESHKGGSSSGMDQPKPGDARGLLELFTVRLTVFCFVGFDLELRAGELVDLALGVVGGDPCGDDGQRLLVAQGSGAN